MLLSILLWVQLVDPSMQLCAFLQVVLVGVPGAYTPVCSSSHIPGFVEKVKEFADKGVDFVGVIANNE